MAPKQKLAVFLIGPQGSGKGTQSDLIQHKYHFHTIAGGDIARGLSKQNTAEGAKVRKLMNDGELLPDLILNHGIELALSKHHNSSLLFDGYPRNLVQANFVAQILTKYGYRQVAIELELDDQECVKRISTRLVCSKCGSVIYKPNHLKKIVHRLRQLTNRCPHCGGKLIRRSDDTVESVKERLQIYHQETEPILDFYRNKGCLHKIDAKPNIPEVFLAVQKLLSDIQHE